MKKFMKWYYGKASIRKKLVISYLILVLLPIGVLGVFSYSTATKNLLKQTRDAISGNVSSIAYNLQSNIAREEDNLKYLSYNVSFREKLETGSKDRTSLARTMNQLVEPAYWYFITSDRNIKGIEIYTPHIKSELGSFLKPDTRAEKRTGISTIRKTSRRDGIMRMTGFLSRGQFWTELRPPAPLAL